VPDADVDSLPVGRALAIGLFRAGVDPRRPLATIVAAMAMRVDAAARVHLLLRCRRCRRVATICWKCARPRLGAAGP
jgi:hypothetical protein